MRRDSSTARRIVWLVALAAIVSAALGTAARRLGNAGSPGGIVTQAQPRSDPGGVAVVELFTSQGCSSCPPADRVLSELAADTALAGRVFPLSFHVDYWNRLGWRDPFSAPRWSERQGRYAAVLGASVYTPQVVVNGRSECVGSRRGEVADHIRRALSRAPAARVELELIPDGPGRWAVSVIARPHAAGGELPERAVIWAALWQDGRRTEVTRGENADRSLANDRVVRRLEKVATFPAGAVEAHGRVTLTADESWSPGGFGVVAFVQDPRTLEIVGAAAARLGSVHAVRSPDRGGAAAGVPPV